MVLEKFVKRLWKKSDGRYQTFIAVELNTKQVFNELKESAKLRQDYDEKKFEIYANEEMAKALKNQN